ncbi:metallophosphoesterase [Ferrimicrobium sp.]|uniref:metallophosphoesterase n=1 Tax=Ferrimicrobium sp. TaxID=2926050 RepID=UPI002634473E|nr:metallophosphoesterase [Ferrimicrobium sp.]
MESFRFVAQRELTPGLMGGFHSLRAEGEPCTIPPGRRLLKLLHLSDIQLADVKSPARYEWVNSFFGVAGFGELIPGYRAQEFLVAHALVAMLRQFNELTSGQDRVCCIVTGDSIDNSQRNELDNFVAAIGGGVVNLQSGDEAMAMVAAHGFGDTSYWHPEPGDDDYKKLWGFPTLEGLLATAFGPIVSPGLSCDWYITNGNHELLVQGLGVTDEAAGSIVVGETKQVSPPLELDPTEALRLGVESPEALLGGGATREVAPDLDRCFIDRRTLVKAIRNAGGTPAGHGLADDEHLYYAAELNDEVVLIGLDTAFSWGGAEGAIDSIQAHWLVEMLERYSSVQLTDEGEQTQSDGEDRLIIVAAHHPLATLTNERAARRSDCYLGDWLLATLLRFPNVIAFVNGHTHENRVRVHHGNGRQLLEVTTSALMDWPCEARSLEITVNQEAIWVTSVMLNVDGVAMPRPDDLSLPGIAAWHRLLAANSPALTLAPHLDPEGQSQDRNFSFRIERPSWLRP